MLLVREASQTVEITDIIFEQAEKLEPFGFDKFDAIQLASAESANVDIILTTDDNFQKVAN